VDEDELDGGRERIERELMPPPSAPLFTPVLHPKSSQSPSVLF
jgi:hypothetical protein